MPENEETIENNGGGSEEQVVVEQPAVTQWKIETDEVESVISLEDAFKSKAEVVEEIVVEQPIVETPITEETPIEVKEEVIVDQSTVVEIDEEKVINFLKEKGFDANSLEELKPKEQEKLDPELEAYLKYKKETNRSYADWMKTQENFAELPKENVLLANLKLENPTLTDSQIERLYKREYDFDAEYDDEDVILDKQINIERDYQKGLAKLESQKEQYKVVRGSDELVPEEYKSAKQLVDNWNKQQEENKVAFEQNWQDFQVKTDNVFTKDFEGFNAKVGEQEFKVKPENIEIVKKNLSDPNYFNQKFFDETGKLKDPEGYYRASYFADNPDKIAEHFINIGRALQVEDDERESKNIKAQSEKNRNVSILNSGKKWTTEED
jgi:archaeosine-15-forming tRNA-guanine transglycosylase